MTKFDSLIKQRLREGATDMDIIDTLVFHNPKLSRAKAESILSGFWRRHHS